MDGSGEVPVPQPRLSLLGGQFLSRSTSHIYENLADMNNHNRVTTAIPVLKRPQNSFLHSTYYKSTVSSSKGGSARTTTTVKTTLAKTTTTTAIEQEALDKQEIPAQMVATLTGQFNALIERRKAEQLQLSGFKKPTETAVAPLSSPTVRSCPSSPQPIHFTRGKWSSFGHAPVRTNKPPQPPISSACGSCDSALEQLRNHKQLTAVQRAARNYEVALQKTTSTLSITSPTATSTSNSTSTCSIASSAAETKLQNGCCNARRTEHLKQSKSEISKTRRPKVKPPEVPKVDLRPEVPSRNNSPLDLLAEIDRHLKVKEENGVRTEPNSSFLWKKSTQRRFHVKAEVEEEVEEEEVGEEEEHLYEELSNFFSTTNGSHRGEVPLAAAEHDSSSSSCGSTSSYGYATATSLAHSLARGSIRSSGSAASSNGRKPGGEAESDGGGSWADDSDDESHQHSPRWRVSRSSWSRSNCLVEVGGEVNSAGESLWEDDVMENVYNEPVADEAGTKGRKKVKRNWSWSKTRTEFHLDIGSKLNRKWPFKGGSEASKSSNRKSSSPTDKSKEANAQFYIPSTSSSTSSSSATEVHNRTQKRSSRPTTAPPAPPVKGLGKDDDDSSSTGISSQSCESVSKEPEEETKRFLYLDDTYYIDGDDKKLSPFENEPLYQFYTMAAQQRAAHENQVDSSEEEDCYESLFELQHDDVKGTDCNAEEEEAAKERTKKVPSAMELVRLTEGGVRTLWCEVPEVVDSGVLGRVTHAQRNVQEAMFEVITSEASYLKSLNILLTHFMSCPAFQHEFSSNCVLSKRERHVLFSDVLPVRETSERLLEALERRWQHDIIINDICDILLHHATKYFNVYVKYCSNQLYQDRCLKKLKESNSEFVEVLRRLESSSVCQGLTMYSFLLLPMQRITRLPLLVDAIFQRLGLDNPIYDNCKQALATLNKIVHECNEGAQQMARMEEMLLISRQIDFRMFKGLALISASRWLIKQGELVRLLLPESTNNKLSFVRARCPKQVVHLFLFTDIIIVTKKKSDDCYHVIDYCPRNMLQVTEGPDQLPDKLLPDGCRNLFQLTMLHNHDGKTIEMFFTCPMESDRTRWVDAIAPKRSNDPDERIYEEWDCPQVQAIHNYTAQQADELSLEESDVVNVFRKMADGWYEGERIRDGTRGWFPSNYTLEIVSSHVRARNLRQRYRLLALSQSYLEEKRKKST